MSGELDFLFAQREWDLVCHWMRYRE